MARVFNASESRFEGWRHCLNIVRINGQRYLVDVGVGLCGPHEPLLMSNNPVNEQGDLSLHRLEFRTVDTLEDPTAYYWVCSHRRGFGTAWAIQYVFENAGFTLSQIKRMNKMTSEPWIDRGNICVRVLDDVVHTMEGIDLIRRRGSASQTTRFDRPEQITDALERIFNIGEATLMWFY